MNTPTNSEALPLTNCYRFLKKGDRIKPTDQYLDAGTTEWTDLDDGERVIFGTLYGKALQPMRRKILCDNDTAQATQEGAD